MKMQTDFLIVGAGLTGSVLARELTNAGATCLVIDKRNHIGGNVYDEMIGDTRVHRYGPHIFHTNDDNIWRYVNMFSEWTPYEHRVKASYKGTVYSFPPNLLTYQQLGTNDKDVIFSTFFEGYSQKQWGRTEIPKSIIDRIPIRQDYDDRYFSDKYQVLPKDGYTKFVENLLYGIEVELNTDYFDNDWQAYKVIYTGPADRLYDLGQLEYRSLRFETEIVNESQGAATINYTDLETPYTRIHEWRYFGWQQSKTNVITREYPVDYDGTNEPYYPINDERNKALYKKYAEKAKEDGIILAGRLGKYQYYDMHQAIGAALALSKRILC